MPLRRVGLRWALVTAALLLAACRGDGSSTQPTPTPDVLVIVTPTPGTPKPVTPTPVAGRTYVVREGDSLSAIAARFGVTEEELQRANDIVDPNNIDVGQELVIPAPEP